VCLSRGTFLDGIRPEDLPRRVEVLPTDGVSLRRALLGDRPDPPVRSAGGTLTGAHRG
jgi:hypothetical protein